jgi:hypothetical protein
MGLTQTGRNLDPKVEEHTSFSPPMGRFDWWCVLAPGFLLAPFSVRLLASRYRMTLLTTTVLGVRGVSRASGPWDKFT